MKSKLTMELAIYAHEAWSGWMKHMVSKSKVYKDGSVCIPADLMERWNRQMNTHYLFLPANEQKSDIDEAHKMITIFDNWKDT